MKSGLCATQLCIKSDTASYICILNLNWMKYVSVMIFRQENTYCISWNEKTASEGTLDKSSNGRRRKLFEFHTQIKFSLTISQSKKFLKYSIARLWSCCPSHFMETLSKRKKLTGFFLNLASHFDHLDDLTLPCA